MFMHTWLPSSNIHSSAAGASAASRSACCHGTRRSRLPKTTTIGWAIRSATPARVIRSATWWDIEGTFATDEASFGAGLVAVDRKRLATGRDFDESGRMAADAEAVVLDEGAESRLAATRAAIASRPAAYPDVIATSARSKAGIPELRAAIARLLAERKPHVIDSTVKAR